jgi:hypothetical protein
VTENFVGLCVLTELDLSLLLLLLIRLFVTAHRTTHHKVSRRMIGRREGVGYGWFSSASLRNAFLIAF